MDQFFEDFMESMFVDFINGLYGCVYETELDELSSTDNDRQNKAINEQYNSETMTDLFDNIFELIRKDSAKFVKTNSKSNQFRMMGNKHFSKEGFRESLRCYTMAIVHAPDSSQKRGISPLNSDTLELALAYGNRSAAFYHLKEFKLCLKDIEASLDAGYRDQRKLYLRKVRCLIGLKHFEEAKVVLNEKLDLNDSEVCLLKVEVEVAEKSTETLSPKVAQPQTVAIDPIEIIGFESSQILSSLSKKVKVCYTPEKGRHIVALERIEPKEVVCADKEPIMLLKPDFDLTYCHYCCLELSLLAHLVPCFQCTSVLYCSEECRDKSWTLYHQYECRYRSVMDRTGVVLCDYLAYRILICTGLKDIYKFAKRSNKLDNCCDLSLDNISGIGLILRLEHHSDKFSSLDLVNTLKSASFLLALAHRSGFMARNAEKEFGISIPIDLDLVVGGVLFRLILLTKMYAIRDVTYCDYQTNNPIPVRISMNPTFLLFNHCCLPNCLPNIFGFHTLIATEPIESGQELTIARALDAHALNKSIEIRQQTLLDRFHFECQCWTCKAEKDLQSISKSMKFTKLNDGFNPLACLQCRSMIVMASCLDENNNQPKVQYLCRNRQCTAAPLTRRQVIKRYKLIEKTLIETSRFAKIKPGKFGENPQLKLDHMKQLHDLLVKQLSFESTSLIQLTQDFTNSTNCTGYYLNAKKFATFGSTIDQILLTRFLNPYAYFLSLSEIYENCDQELRMAGASAEERLANLNDCARLTEVCLEFYKNFAAINYGTVGYEFNQKLEMENNRKFKNIFICNERLIKLRRIREQLQKATI